MCGIVGFIGKTALREPEINQLVSSDGHGTLSSRGPDLHGDHVVENRVWFRHYLLSLRGDAHASAQPVHCGDRNAMLVYNGEIYSSSSYRLVEQRGGDTAFLFDRLLREPVKSVARDLNGMFAFAFFRDGDVFLVRDRLGIKPLFYTVRTEGVYFSSEMKALREFNPDIRVDPSAVIDGLRFPGGAETIPFSEVQEVPPGGMVVVKPDGSLEKSDYFLARDWIDPEYASELAAGNEKRLLADYEERLTTALERSCVGNQVSALILSGGLDSNLLASLSGARFSAAFTVSSCFDDEHAVAAATAKMLKVPHHSITVSHETLLHSLVEATWSYEAPVTSRWNAVALHGLCAKVRDAGIRSVISGEGADELMFGYHGDRIYRRPYGNLGRLLGRLSERVEMRLGTSPPTERTAFLESFLPGKIGDSRMARPVGDLSTTRELRQTIFRLYSTLSGLLWRNDRMGMAHGVECRFPYLDIDLMRFAINAPLNTKLRGGWRFVYDRKTPFLADKWVSRKILSRRRGFSRAAWRPKLGFPIDKSYRAFENREWLRRSAMAEMLKISEKDIPGFSLLEIRNILSGEVFLRLFQGEQGPNDTTEWLLRAVSGEGRVLAAC